MSPSVTEEDDDEDDIVTVDTDDSMIAWDLNGDPETYFNDLSKYISSYAIASTNLALHLVLGRKHFQKKKARAGSMVTKPILNLTEGWSISPSFLMD